MFELKLTLVDAMDILLLAFVLYSLFTFIRGTQALQIFIGLLVVLFFAALARFYSLPAVSWLVRSFEMVWVLVFCILFQQELRQALANIGRSRFFRIFLGVSSELVDEVVHAVDVLAKRGVGAIIVFERDIGLGEYIDKGVKIWANVYAELLISILQPEGPLHDGAVIIRGNKIAACAVMLPISVDPHITRYLGARHRAAIGASEVSDAIVVVISEETRKVAIAQDGKLSTINDMVDLQQSLIQLLSRKKRGK
jgi:diadenylate cyclase